MVCLRCDAMMLRYDVRCCDARCWVGFGWVVRVVVCVAVLFVMTCIYQFCRC